MKDQVFKRKHFTADMRTQNRAEIYSDLCPSMKMNCKDLKRTGRFKGQIIIPTEIDKSEHLNTVKIGNRISGYLKNGFWTVSV